MARTTQHPIQQFRGSSTALDAYTGPEGELTYDRTNKALRVQDGTMQGGNALLDTDTAQDIVGVKDFTTAPTVPTQAPNDGSFKAASTEYVDRAIEDIDPASFDKASKTQFGMLRVGRGLHVNNGIIGVGSIDTPSITSPSQSDTVVNAGFTVTGTAFSTAFIPDMHVRTRYIVEQNGAIIADVTSATDLTSHTFTSGELTGIVEGPATIRIQYTGAAFGESEWSASVNVDVIEGQLTPFGRIVYRHPTLAGSVVLYKEFGVAKKLFVVDSTYRAKKQWKRNNVAVQNYDIWPHEYWPLSEGNVIDSIAPIYLTNVADLRPYAAQLTDEHFSAALQETLAPIMWTATAATEYLANLSGTYSYSVAAYYCRHAGYSGLELQLPTPYQALVMYAEGDTIDALDPTITETSEARLGWSAYYGQRMYMFSKGAIWTTMQSGQNRGAHLVTAACGLRSVDMTYEYGVAPIAELD